MNTKHGTEVIYQELNDVCYEQRRIYQNPVGMKQNVKLKQKESLDRALQDDI